LLFGSCLKYHLWKKPFLPSQSKWVILILSSLSAVTP
jgi:hypothetical protein